MVEQKNTGVVYRYVAKDNPKQTLYVGGTFNFSRRKRCHRFDFKNSSYPFHTAVREKGLDVSVEVLEDNIPGNPQDRHGLDAREKHFFKLLKPTYGVICAGRSMSEWYQDNRDIKRERDRNYNKVNKERISAHRKTPEYRRNANATRKIRYSKMDFDERNKHNRNRDRTKYLAYMKEYHKRTG